MCTLYVSNCNQEQVKYLRMFVMPHLEQTDVNMTKHGVQSERKLKTDLYERCSTDDEIYYNYNPFLLTLVISETTLEQLGNVTAPNTVRCNCNQEQIQYLRMFVMPNLERNDVNMTYHVAQSKRNTIKTQLMT
ncbi:hypothetical protein T01_457 [Trichinella spiralis]|uniref:Uncharacterized protein n=1 Tax=Trichinella spiralis TaxID=6334 RepID=A0A0V1BPE4_TRISP|nr:hypothetical protein T01_457 [Trichinella spiralis]